MMIEGEWLLASPEMHRAQFLTEECQRGTLQTFSEAGTFGTSPAQRRMDGAWRGRGDASWGPGRDGDPVPLEPPPR